MAWTLRSRRAVADGSRPVDSRTSSINSGAGKNTTTQTEHEGVLVRSPGSVKPSLASLPPEIHLAISQLLIYPDALSLKHTNRYFYGLVDTGIELKIKWLIQRRSLHLECPSDRRCDLGSDLRFCRGSVPLLMKRRREHIECDSRPGLGCLVFGTKTCVHRRRQSRWQRWLSTKLTIELWWVLLAVVPTLFLSSWLVELFGSPQMVTRT